jgi:hypothetical protein
LRLTFSRGGVSSDDATAVVRPRPEHAKLKRAIARCSNILTLATALLRLCRDEVEALIRADTDPAIWKARDRLRRQAIDLFTEIDDEDIDEEDRAAIGELVDEASSTIPTVAIARTIAEALDAALGDRFLPMFLNRSVTLRPDHAIPTPHPDWRHLTPSPNSDPWALDGRLDALPHLRLAGQWARQVRVTLEGDWRTWHMVPQLRAGDHLACATPNESFEEMTWKRDTYEDRPVFFDVRPNVGDAEQGRRCIALLELAAQRRCRVVVFPELSVTKRVLERIASWLDEQDVVDVVLAGSRHRRARDGRWHNQATLVARGFQRRLTHRKFRPFVFYDDDDSGSGRVRRYEHLSSAPPKIRAWLSPCWTMTMMVCKDAILEPMPHLLGDLRANLVMVPCLSFKMDAFRTAAADIATRSQGVALMANAAIASRKHRGGRPEIVVGLPSQRSSVIAKGPPPHSLLIVTIGKGSPQVATVRR